MPVTEDAVGTRPRKASAFPVLTAVIGSVIAVPAAMHVVEVIRVALGERGGYDARLSSMLWIGWTSLVCGLLMLAAVPGLRRRSAVALYVAAGGAAVFLVGTALVAPVSPGFLAGVPIFGGYLVLAVALRRRHGIE